MPNKDIVNDIPEILAKTRIKRIIEGNFDPDEPKLSVVTLLTDLRFFCTENGLDFAALDRLAYRDYLTR